MWKECISTQSRQHTTNPQPASHQMGKSWYQDPPESDTTWGCPPTHHSSVPESPAITTRQEKETKGVRIGRKKIQVDKYKSFDLFVGDMILYVQEQKDSIQRLQEATKEFSKAAGYKIYIEKYTAFLYTSSALAEKIRSILFTLAKNLKNLY